MLSPRVGRDRVAPVVLGLLSSFVALWDFTSGIISGYASLLWFRDLRRLDAGVLTLTGPFIREIILGSLLATVLLYDRKLSDPTRFVTRDLFLREVSGRWLNAALLLFAVGLLTREFGDISRLWVCSWLLGFFALIAVGRVCLSLLFRNWNAKGLLRKAVAIVGKPAPVARMIDLVKGDANVIYVVNDDCKNSGFQENTVEDLVDLSRSGQIDSVVLALEENEGELEGMLEAFRAMPVDVAIYKSNGGEPLFVPELRVLGKARLSIILERPLRPVDSFLKGAFDGSAAFFLLMIFSPLMITIAVVIMAQREGPVFFRQPRSGWGGRDFKVIKFRTMHISDRTGLQTSRRDPRVTGFGAFLRRFSLDELPQLFNVLVGDMSLVGPRPHANNLHAELGYGEKLIANYASRYRVKPGITGWAQIHGSRGAITSAEEMQKRLQYDLYYIKNWSFFLDLEIIFRTISCVLGGRNAF